MPGLGRLVAPDPRDHAFLLAAALPSEPVTLPPRMVYARGPILDQQSTSSCVGHAWRAWLSGAPVRTSGGPNAFQLYDACLPLDEFPENDHDTERQMGTSVRAGARVLSNAGRVSVYRWAYDIGTIRQWVLGGHGTVVLGIAWYDAMFRPDAEGIIRARGSVVGGHAIFLFGIDDTAGMAFLQNSWGTSFGGWTVASTRRPAYAGCCKLPLEDLATLLKDQGEACTAVEIRPKKVLGGNA